MLKFNKMFSALSFNILVSDNTNSFKEDLTTQTKNKRKEYDNNQAQELVVEEAVVCIGKHNEVEYLIIKTTTTMAAKKISNKNCKKE